MVDKENVGDNAIDDNANEKDDRRARLTTALESDVEQIYFNSFVSSIGSGDILIVLERHGKPVAILNTSYTVAKTFALKLAQLIGNLEGLTGNTIMTTDDVAAKLAKRNPNEPDE
jgi:hypothetical protein